MKTKERRKKENEKNMINNNRGITLIALVVTIIVIIIIASISIKVVINDDGIIKRAEETKLRADYTIVKQGLEMYKLKAELSLDADSYLTDEMLIGEIYKKVILTDTQRELAVLADFSKIGVKPSYGKGGEALVKEDGNDMATTKEVSSIYSLGNMYAVDLEDGTLYYINGEQIYSESEKIEVANEDGTTTQKYQVETISSTYMEKSKFKTKWNVILGEEDGSETYSMVVLPVYNTGTYDATIEWGDGTSTLLQHRTNGVTLTNEELIEKVTHNYTLETADDGMRTISISGTYSDFRMETTTSTPTKLKILELEQWGNTNFAKVNFYGCKNLGGSIPAPNIEKCFANVTSFNYLFQGCSSITEISEGFTIPNGVTSMYCTFSGCSSLASLPNSFTIPDSVKTIENSFSGCSSLVSLPEGFTIPDSVANMRQTFHTCSSLASLPEGFTIPNGVTSMYFTFYKCSSLTSLPKSFTIGNSVTNMQATFYGCSSLASLPEGFAIPDSVTNMQYAFFGCGSLANLPEGFTIPSNVTDIANLLHACPKLKGTITIKANPSSYTRCFYETAKSSEGTLTVNYTANCTNIDEILATGNSTYVVKGSLVE